MRSMKTKYDYKLIFFSVILLGIVAIAFHFYWGVTKFIIRKILEEKFTYFLLWAITVLIFLINYFKHKSKDIASEPVITLKFGAFIDNFFGGIGYATAITTSLTLLKGIYIQNFFSDKTFFMEFNDVDMFTIFGVVVFILYFSFLKVVEIAKIIYKVEHTEQVLNNNKEVVVSKIKI